MCEELKQSSSTEDQLRPQEIARLEAEHRQSYLDAPETEEERSDFERWQSVQDWGDEWEA